MEEASKKISFGFSKISKKPAISKAPTVIEEEKQFIKGLEGKSIKLVREEPKKKELVIPLINGNSLRDNMLECIRLRNQSSQLNGEAVVRAVNGVKATDQEVAKPPEQSSLSETSEESKPEQPNKPSETPEESRPSETPEESKPPETLDEMAAREILEDLKKAETESEEAKVMTVPLTDKSEETKKESTLEDYENVPVEAFGLAMLRGMGWQPGKGIGKNEQLVVPSQPTLRPKGMGLGADKVIKQQPTTSDAPLPLIKGAFVKVLTGPRKNLYGTVVGFDETPGRVLVKLSLNNEIVNFTEFSVCTVPKQEFQSNSKVINIKKYDEFKQNSNSTDPSSRIKEPSQTREEKVSKHNCRSVSSSDSDNESRKYKKSRHRTPEKRSSGKSKYSRYSSHSSEDERNERKDYKKRRSPSPYHKSSKHKSERSHSRSKKKMHKHSRSSPDDSRSSRKKSRRSPSLSPPRRKHSGKHRH